jgi:hypothetical protein
MENTTPIKAYYKSELAEMYGVTLLTFICWLKPFIDKKILELEPNQKILKPAQVKIIFDCLGTPDKE